MKTQTKNGLQVLKFMALERNLEKFPNVPISAMTIKGYSDKKANNLTRCIIDFIGLCGGQAERISSEGRVIDTRRTFTDCIGRIKSIGSIKRIKSSGQLGTADISAVMNGLSIKIEVKIGNDRQSEAQKRYQESIEKAGGFYFIAKDFQSFYEWFNLNFVQP